MVAGAPRDHPEDQLARPDRALQREGDGEGDIDNMLRARRRGGIGCDQVDRGDDHEEDGGPRQHSADDVAPADRHVLALACDHALADGPRDQHQPDQPKRDQRAEQDLVAVGDEPVEDGDVGGVGHRRRMADERGRIKGEPQAAFFRRGFLLRNFRKAVSALDRLRRARGRVMPRSGSRGRSLTASISDGWT